MSAPGNSDAHKIIFTKNIPNLQTLKKNCKMWCLVCGKYASEHQGICRAKISQPQLKQLIQKMGISPGKPLAFPESIVLTSSAAKCDVVIEIN